MITEVCCKNLSKQTVLIESQCIMYNFHELNLFQLGVVYNAPGNQENESSVFCVSGCH